MVNSKWGSRPPRSIDCAGILKLRNADIELRKGETDIGRKNTRVRLVFRVHIPEASGRIISLQTASNPIECCKLGAGQRRPSPRILNVTFRPRQGDQQECAGPAGVDRGPRDDQRAQTQSTLNDFSPLSFACGRFCGLTGNEKIIQLTSSLRLCLEDSKTYKCFGRKKGRCSWSEFTVPSVLFSFPLASQWLSLTER